VTECSGCSLNGSGYRWSSDCPVHGVERPGQCVPAGASPELAEKLRAGYAAEAAPAKRRLTLPTDSDARKEIPIYGGCVRYFPAALVEIAKVSKRGNDKHNPGQPLHWARSKSMDQEDCILRHLIDVSDLLADADAPVPADAIEEAAALAWRALATLQLLCERAGAPKAPGAK
jgi:hypothetical protein